MVYVAQSYRLALKEAKAVTQSRNHEGMLSIGSLALASSATFPIQSRDIYLERIAITMGLDHLHQINNQQNVPRDVHIGQSDGVEVILLLRLSLSKCVQLDNQD